MQLRIFHHLLQYIPLQYIPLQYIPLQYIPLQYIRSFSQNSLFTFQFLLTNIYLHDEMQAIILTILILLHASFSRIHR